MKEPKHKIGEILWCMAQVERQGVMESYLTRAEIKSIVKIDLPQYNTIHYKYNVVTLFKNDELYLGEGSLLNTKKQVIAKWRKIYKASCEKQIESHLFAIASAIGSIENEKQRLQEKYKFLEEQEKEI